MPPTNDSVRVLSVALDQAGDVLAQVHRDQLAAPTPCTDWTVGDLVDHLVAAPGRFLQAVRGEQPDWSATAEPAREGWAALFRSRADDLRHALHQLADADETLNADWQTAELAVHTWDLATAIGRGTADLDPAVAERGLAFMRENLTPDNRGDAFGAEQPIDSDANAYDRIAAFAGRSVG